MVVITDKSVDWGRNLFKTKKWAYSIAKTSFEFFVRVC